MLTYFEEDFLLANVLNSSDQSDSLRFGGKFIDKAHTKLDHINQSLLRLASLLSKEGNKFVEFIVFPGLESYSHLELK